MSQNNHTAKDLLLAVSLAIFGVSALCAPASAENTLQDPEALETVRQAYIFSFPLMRS